MLEQRPDLRMGQKLSPRMLYTIKLMALPLQELRQNIQEELERNPALEEATRDQEPSLQKEDHSQGDEDSFEEGFDPIYTLGGEGEEDIKQQLLETLPGPSQSLQDLLIWQLHMVPLTEEQLALGELIISNLDSHGFHCEDPYNLHPKASPEDVATLIHLIQTFDPPGVCVTNHRESLLLQARLRGDSPEELAELLDNHLEALKGRKYQDIARAMGITIDRLDYLVDYLQGLNPYPGSDLQKEEPHYAIPDLFVRKDERGELQIFLNEDEIPRLELNPEFSELARGNRTEASTFARRYISEAKQLMDSLRERNTTLIRTAQILLEYQREFFLKGPKYVRPLILKTVAAEVGRHESTISRISNKKYIQTEWGIFELKYFFSSALPPKNGLDQNNSKEGVKATVREIIQKAGREGQRLSDQKISDILAQQGITIARRTVAKYRKELDISSSFDR